MNYQQVINMGYSSWPQRHLDANLRRRGLADVSLGSYRLSPRQWKTLKGKIQMVVARGTVAPKNHSPATFLRTELYSVSSVLAKPQCPAKPSRGPLSKKERRPLKCPPSLPLVPTSRKHTLTCWANEVNEGQNGEDRRLRNPQPIPGLPGLLFSKAGFSIIN